MKNIMITIFIVLIALGVFGIHLTIYAAHTALNLLSNEIISSEKEEIIARDISDMTPEQLKRTIINLAVLGQGPTNC